MELTLSPVSSKISSLLAGTRIVKKFMKGANKIHTKFERDYLKLASVCDSSKCSNFKELFDNYLSYIKSFLKFNENIIMQTQMAYETLKRTSLELKSKISIVKVEKKTMKRMKNDKNDENIKQIIKRCKDLLLDTSKLTKIHVEDALNSHLFSLKFLKKHSEYSSNHFTQRPMRHNSSNISNPNFEQELEESLQKKTQSKIQNISKLIKNSKEKGFKVPEASMTDGLSVIYSQDFVRSFMNDSN